MAENTTSEMDSTSKFICDESSILHFCDLISSSTDPEARAANATLLCDNLLLIYPNMSHSNKFRVRQWLITAIAQDHNKHIAIKLCGLISDLANTLFLHETNPWPLLFHSLLTWLSQSNPNLQKYSLFVFFRFPDFIRETLYSMSHIFFKLIFRVYNSTISIDLEMTCLRASIRLLGCILSGDIEQSSLDALLLLMKKTFTEAFTGVSQNNGNVQLLEAQLQEALGMFLSMIHVVPSNIKSSIRHSFWESMLMVAKENSNHYMTKTRHLCMNILLILFKQGARRDVIPLLSSLFDAAMTFLIDIDEYDTNWYMLNEKEISALDADLLLAAKVHKTENVEKEAKAKDMNNFEFGRECIKVLCDSSMIAEVVMAKSPSFISLSVLAEQPVPDWKNEHAILNVFELVAPKLMTSSYCVLPAILRSIQHQDSHARVRWAAMKAFVKFNTLLIQHSADKHIRGVFSMLKKALSYYDNPLVQIYGAAALTMICKKCSQETLYHRKKCYQETLSSYLDDILENLLIPIREAMEFLASDFVPRQEILTWLDMVANNLLHLFISRAPLVREEAVLVVYDLLTFKKLNIKKEQPTYVLPMAHRVLACLVEVMPQEENEGVLDYMCTTLKICREILSEESLDDEQIRCIVVEAIKNVIQKEYEHNNILKFILDYLGTIIKTFRTSFLVIFDELSPILEPLFVVEGDNSTSNIRGRRIAICIFNGVAEQCSKEVHKYYDPYLQLLLGAFNDDCPDIREAAVYGVGVCAEFGESAAFKPFVADALSGLESVKAQNADDGKLYEKAVLVLNKIRMLHSC